MVSVFLAFVLGPDRIIKEFGIGLSTAIFVDATIVRIFLVPSTMELLKEANWWMPKWLDRVLPHISVEGPVERTRLPEGTAGGK
jgi:RND superfamily putative drug exporter